MDLPTVNVDRGPDPMQPTDPPSDRLVQIESALMHVARDVEALHETIRVHEREIDALRRALEQLQSAWEREEGPSPQTRDPAAEKPPHY
jgi:uncharacterized coiled-coil protein SlyX